MKCLDIISLRGSASPSQLAALTGLTTGSTTAMIDRLEKRRLIARRPNPTDRRGTTVVLTAHAMRKLPALFKSLSAAIEALTARYTEAELATVADFFARAAVLWRHERERVQKTAGKRRSRSRES
jgi:DNA-binding MarR family transcriptional regulator